MLLTVSRLANATATLILTAIVVGWSFGAVAFSTPNVAQPSPTHVVAQFVDGFNHYDFRAVCQAIDPNSISTEQSCAGYFATSTVMFGTPHYRLVAHSARVWTETYRGRQVELAVVAIVDGTTGHTLTAHLRKTKHGWRIWAVN